MKQKKYDFARDHMLMTEYMTRAQSKYAAHCDLVDPPYALLETSLGLIRYIHTCARFQVELLGVQLGKLDPLTEPELSQMFESLFDRAYDLWDFSDDFARIRKVDLMSCRRRRTPTAR